MSRNIVTGSTSRKRLSRVQDRCEQFGLSISRAIGATGSQYDRWRGLSIALVPEDRGAASRLVYKAPENDHLQLMFSDFADGLLRLLISSWPTLAALVF